MKVLCVAEKPSIAKSVAFTLGGGRVTTRSTPNKFIKNYDFTCNFEEFGPAEVTMTCVSGHITTIDFPEQYAWGKCRHNSLFEAPIETKATDRGAKQIAENITKEARSSDVLMIWTDCDREGEYIGYEIVEQAKKSNPRLNLDTAKRAHFSHLERSHIIYAAHHPKSLDKNAINAVMTRIELDLRTGSSFTRFLTDLFKSTFRNETKKKVISYGGCQFPTLGFVVDRYKRIKNFVPEKFWTLSLIFKKGRQQTSVTWERGHLFDRFAALCIYQNCLSLDAEEATVIGLQTKPTSNWAPLPLTTVELQKDCAKYFKFSAKESLAIAEKLYNQGFVSYPRTETDCFPKTMDLKKLIQNQQQSNEWGEYARSLIEEPNKYRTPRAGSHDDKAHPPIHPIKYTGGSDLNIKEKKVYEYIVRRFLACCSLDATGFKTTLRLKWGTEYFTTSGLMVDKLNYLDVYPYNKWESSKNKIPEVEPNERIKLHKAELTEGQTHPPNHLTETELIALMDMNGIGTDATIAEHIEKIVAREYVEKKPHGTGKNKSNILVPTELGYGLAEGFNQMGFDNISLTKPFMRKSLEEKLKAICDGRTTMNEVLGDVTNTYREAFSLANRNQRILIESYKKTIEGNQ
ncbi:hypothetical protein CANARDRAFT_29324 [[Candida] arabinofermentans NRRL YB-2248]|uniref:DNA topoisomerase n=1 Tax=[Candida] arabinofermentans NRRL YB-2248 TaxID=983967 RepID=A0A1E4SXJ5_9ASCO|nr:hypothetical protein CANARDRAFT_29324 [[Candida] arabinofermentans NRRL YB-2248]